MLTKYNPGVPTGVKNEGLTAEEILWNLYGKNRTSIGPKVAAVQGGGAYSITWKGPSQVESGYGGAAPAKSTEQVQVVKAKRTPDGGIKVVSSATSQKEKPVTKSERGGWDTVDHVVKKKPTSGTVAVPALEDGKKAQVTPGGGQVIPDVPGAKDPVGPPADQSTAPTNYLPWALGLAALGGGLWWWGKRKK